MTIIETRAHPFREDERMFEAVDKEERGELFGVENLMRYSVRSQHKA
jgi:hypothetical protein